MADPDSAHHIVRLNLEIDGQRYGVLTEPLRATKPSEIEKLADDLATLIRNTVRNHFGMALAAED